jgi:hypothetical protein
LLEVAAVVVQAAVVRMIKAPHAGVVLVAVVLDTISAPVVQAHTVVLTALTMLVVSVVQVTQRLVVQVVGAERRVTPARIAEVQTHDPAVPAVRQETISLVTHLLLGQQLAPVRVVHLNWRRYEQREI